MAASSSTAGEIKHALQNDCDGLRIALAGGAFDTIIPSASTFVASSSQMAASSSTAGEIKCALQNDCDGLRIALAGGAFDTILPSASNFVASSSGTKLTPYDVFINHCGQDVKPTLASRIYESLNSTGLRVFLDKHELKYGNLLPKALENAMATASIYIAIFSEHYAESPWCLAELEYMVKTCKTIIPIFYHVQPSVLRWVDGGKGAYADAFSEHVKKSRYAPEVLQQWKQALQQVSCCIGDIVNNIDDEQRVVKAVVNHVMKEMNKVPLDVAKYPVGLTEVVQDFNKIAFQSADSIHTVGIWGLGGSGKTTLAKEIFNKTHSNMQWSSFLSDVRDADRKGLLLEKQKKLLKDLYGEDLHFDNLDEGKQILKNRLSRPVSVLIVLDDVDRIDQLDALLPAKDSLGPGSLIIITTRIKDVVQQWGISAIYPMKPLNAAHAKQLFCWHAFLLNSPPPRFEEIVEEFLKACQGLPLSLKVLGGLLYGKSDNDYWQHTLNKFSQIPHEDIQKTLKISYDALEKEEQEMFLDAACLFIGQRKSAVIEAWDAEENWYGSLGWESLFNKCLVEEDTDGLVRMHDHLRDLGRDIANGQSPHRLWSARQVIEIPPQQDAMVRVRGIANAVGKNCYQRQGKIIINTNQEECSLAPSSLGLKIFVGNGEVLSQELSQLWKKLIWLHCNKFEHKNLPSWLALKELRILDLSDSRSLEHLWTEDADAPLQLTELVIRRCKRLAGFPRSIGHLKNLKRILINDNYYTSCDALSDLPQEFCFLRSLEHLEMRSCPNLSSLPSNFGKLTKLRHLNLQGSTKLEALPDSFKKLTLLEYLSLQSCRELTIKSELNVLENMTKLRYLNLEGCEKLEDLRLPESVSLRDLHLMKTGLKELPANIFHLTKLTELEIGSHFLTTLPTCVGNLSPLTTLTIGNCQKLESLPDSLENLTDLRYLTMDQTGVQCLPKSLVHLQSLTIRHNPVCELSFRSWCMLKSIVLWWTEVSKISFGGDSCPALETLELYGNYNLRVLETLPEKLKTLQVDHCEILKDIKGVCGLKELKSMAIRRCTELDVLPCFSQLLCLEKFRLEGSSEVKKIAGLQKLRSLRELSIQVDELPRFVELTSLQKLVLRKCNKLEKIESLENLISLEELNISGCPELKALPGLGEITSLKTIQLESCNKLEKVEVSTSLKKIGLEYLSKLEKIEGLENIRSLGTLVIHSCPKLSGLPDLAKLTSLTEFALKGCNELKKIESLENITSLQKLVIYECPILDGLQGLAELTSLKEFELGWCKKLEKIESLEHLKSLEKLTITDFPELEVLPSLPEITSLNEFQLKGCHKLEKVKGLGNIRCLEKLMIYDCPISEGLQGLAKLTSLKKIELQRCNKLEKIESLEHLKSLEEINISDCPELEVLASVPETISLEKIKLERCHKLEKVDSFKNIRSLEKLTICDCPKLDGLQDLTKLSSLINIELHKCNKLQKIESLENIRLLKELKITDCPRLGGLLSLAELPSLENIVLRKCSKLKKVKICNCPQLHGCLTLKEFTSLEEFELQRCPKLWGLSIDDFPQLNILFSLAELPSLKYFNLRNCPKLKKIEGLENIKSLEKLRISDSPELATIKITSLKAFELKNCYKLEKRECWKHLKSLEELRLIDCSDLEVLSSIAEITSLKHFQLEKCSKLKKMEGLENIKSLEMFKISDCSELEALPEITSLKILQLEKWHKKLEGLENMSSLEELNISDCSELITLPEITSLKKLELKRCPALKKIDGLGNMKSLEELIISDCLVLESLPSLSEITSLKILQLEKWHKKLEGLENMSSLEELNISDCSELETLPEITSLKKLELKRCPALKKIDGLRNMKSLPRLIISDCSELESLPSLSEITSLKSLKLEKYYKLEKVEGLERLISLEVNNLWNVPCIFNLQHSQSLQRLVVVANNISVVEPFVTSIQEWPREVMICTRPVCDMGLLKNFFQNLPNVSFLDYTDVVEVDSCLELRCFIIDSDHPDLRFSIKYRHQFYQWKCYGAFFNTELGEGKWVWMWLSEYFFTSNEDYILACDSEGEDVKVRLEAAWLVDAFRQHFQRWPTNELATEEASATVDGCQ